MESKTPTDKFLSVIGFILITSGTIAFATAMICFTYMMCVAVIGQ